MKVAVVGLGYIGLPTAVTIANAGIPVYGYDINEKLVSEVTDGKTYIKEEGFVEALKKAISTGMLKVGTEMKNSDYYLIAVNTSLNKANKKINLQHLKSACASVGAVLKKGDVIIVESTVTPGTTENILIPIIEEKSGLECCEDFHIAYCPERVLPGNLMYELIHNDRIVGGADEKSGEKVREFYSHYVKGKIHVTDVKTAELAKLMENTYRAVNIALANELALIVEKVGGNVYKAIEMANSHPRVNIHLPGPGVGGYCLTKDPWFLIEDYSESKIIKESLEINSYMPEHVVEIVENALRGKGKEINGAKIAVLGLAYKGNVSDPRESPGYEVYLLLLNKGARVVIHDPYVEEYMGYVPERSIEDAVKDADAVVITTEHNIYGNIDWNALKELMAENPVIVDTKNIINGVELNVVKLGVRE